MSPGRALGLGQTREGVAWGVRPVSGTEGCRGVLHTYVSMQRDTPSSCIRGRLLFALKISLRFAF